MEMSCLIFVNPIIPTYMNVQDNILIRFQYNSKYFSFVCMNLMLRQST